MKKTDLLSYKNVDFVRFNLDLTNTDVQGLFNGTPYLTVEGKKYVEILDYFNAIVGGVVSYKLYFDGDTETLLLRTEGILGPWAAKRVVEYLPEAWIQVRDGSMYICIDLK